MRLNHASVSDPSPALSHTPRTGYRSGDKRDERRRISCRALDRSLILSAKCPPADRFMLPGHGSQSPFCVQEQLQRDKTALCLKLKLHVAVLVKGCKPRRICWLVEYMLVESQGCLRILSTPGGISLNQYAGAASAGVVARPDMNSCSGTQSFPISEIILIPNIKQCRQWHGNSIRMSGISTLRTRDRS